MSDKPRVELREGVVFGTGGGRDLMCDVFLPPDVTGPVPAVVLAHGGAWQVGNPQQLRGYGFLIGREGFVCVAPEYRLTGEASWPAQLHDLKAAVRWVRANAGDLRVDPDRIIVSGNSSGGHLSLMLATTGDRPDLDGEGGSAGVSSAVAGAVSFYGPTRLEPGGDMLIDSVVALMGADAGADAYRDASPISHVSGAMPPIMLLHSNLDALVPRRQSLDMYEALTDAGVATELHMYDGAPHDFDANPALGREAASLIVSFIRRHVTPPR